MKNFADKYSEYKKKIDERLNTLLVLKEPKSLYDPVNYIISGGGKRIRPAILLFTCEAVGGNADEALDAGAAIEILHNFTLVHDDIMDNADTRRGNATVHKKWNVNTAILAGDNLIAIAYKSLLKTKSPVIEKIAGEFTDGVIEVCEGQSYDKDFENEPDVTIDKYLMMIQKKTAKLIEVSAVMGAIIGGGTDEQIENIRNFAVNSGLAFQIQDDLLDIIADEKEFGKKIGGDLIEGKKTYLLLKSLEVVNKNEDRERIEAIVKNSGIKENQEKEILRIKKIYEEYGIIESAKNEIEKFTEKAEHFIKDFPSEHKNMLKAFSQMLLERNF
ncbi:MAG: polyprenyl synthetase family protein [Ignavibacteria bacterium]|nr:polyprenyl synthetase family protein [Ignavibacteria bacterium]